VSGAALTGALAEQPVEIVVARGFGFVARDRDGIATPLLSEWDVANDEHRLAFEAQLDELGRRTGRSVTNLCDALLQRETFLTELSQRGVRRPTAVRDAIAAYRGA
jgi:hypothetical protein